MIQYKPTELGFKPRPALTINRQEKPDRKMRKGEWMGKILEKTGGRSRGGFQTLEREQADTSASPAFLPETSDQVCPGHGSRHSPDFKVGYKGKENLRNIPHSGPTLFLNILKPILSNREPLILCGESLGLGGLA